ncbi:ABC transporter ATP-binding protein [Mycoplasma sp. 1654_15]|nr:ABC transporter ATP-binding protein [Mycoplasma sp. 1654_15]
MKTFKSTLDILNQDRKNNFLVFIIKTIYMVCLNLHIFSYSYIIDFINYQNKSDNSNFILWILITCFSFVFFVVFKLLYTFQSNKTTFIIYQKNTDRVSKIIIQKPYQELVKNKETYMSYYNLNLMFANSLTSTIYLYLFPGIISIIFPTIFMFSLNVQSWILILHCVVGSIISGFLLFKYSPLLHKIQGKIQLLLQEYTSKEIKLFGLINLFYFFNKRNIFTKYLKSQLLQKYTQEYDLFKSFQFKSFLLNVVFSFFVYSNFITLGVLTYNKTFDISQFISLFMLNMSLLSGVASLYSFLLTEKALNPYINVIFEKTNDDNSKKITLKENIFKIDFKNLSFSYNQETPIFSNLNLTFEKNQKYAIISPSGKGKSLFLKLISGLLSNYEGEILINNSIEYKNVNPKEISKNIALVTNENVIFEDSLLNNITLWDTKPDLDRVNFLLNKYKINQFSKIDANISPANLSEGEKQKVNLARLEYKNLNIWCLDEALDNIFKEDAIEIYKDILSRPDKTIFVASHHISEEIKPLFDQIIEI